MRKTKQREFDLLAQDDRDCFQIQAAWSASVYHPDSHGPNPFHIPNLTSSGVLLHGHQSSLIETALWSLEINFLCGAWLFSPFGHHVSPNRMSYAPAPAPLKLSMPLYLDGPCQDFPDSWFRGWDTKIVRVCVNRSQKWIYKRDPAWEKGPKT